MPVLSPFFPLTYDTYHFSGRLQGDRWKAGRIHRDAREPLQTAGNQDVALVAAIPYVDRAGPVGKWPPLLIDGESAGQLRAARYNRSNLCLSTQSVADSWPSFQQTEL